MCSGHDEKLTDERASTLKKQVVVDVVIVQGGLKKLHDLNLS